MHKRYFSPAGVVSHVKPYGFELKVTTFGYREIRNISFYDKLAPLRYANC